MGKLKYLLLLSILIFSLTFISASPIIINSSSFSYDIVKGVTSSIIFNITNPNTYDLYDIDISGVNIVSSSDVAILPAGQSRSITLNIQYPTNGNFTNQYKFFGFTRINCSTITSITKDINITSAGASPRNENICKNSNIKFFNGKTSSVRVVIESLSIDQLIAPGSSYSQLYSSIGNYVYRIEPFIDLGNIEVVDTSQNVFNENDAGFVTLNIKARAESTTLETTFSKIDFNLSFNAIENGFVILRNTGNFRAENINFFSSWITFDQHNFFIEPGQEKAINYVVAPDITVASDTGKSYNKTVTITSDNVGDIKQDFTIFVKFSDIASGNLSSPEWWIRRKQFCEAFPTAPDCLTEPIIVYRDVPQYDCPAIMANLSAKDVVNALQQCEEIKNNLNSFTNIFKLDSDVFKNNLYDIKDYTNKSLEQDIKGNEIVNNLKEVFYSFMGLLFFGIVMATTIFISFRFYQRKKIDTSGEF